MTSRLTDGQKISRALYGFDHTGAVKYLDRIIRKRMFTAWEKAVDHMERTGGLISVARDENPYRGRKKK